MSPRDWMPWIGAMPNSIHQALSQSGTDIHDLFPYILRARRYEIVRKLFHCLDMKLILECNQIVIFTFDPVARR